MNITWRKNGNIVNAFFGKPEESVFAAVVYPYDGGFLWEIRQRNKSQIKLCKRGSAREIQPALKAVQTFMLALQSLITKRE